MSNSIVEWRYFGSIIIMMEKKRPNLKGKDTLNRLRKDEKSMHRFLIFKRDIRSLKRAIRNAIKELFNHES